MIVSKKMQDAAMRAIIDYYDKHPKHYIDERFLIHQGICNESEVYHLIDVLCAKELITYDNALSIKTIRLKDDGKKYFEDKAEETSKSRKESIRYWITTTIAVAALIKAFLPEISAGLAWLSTQLTQ